MEGGCVLSPAGSHPVAQNGPLLSFSGCSSLLYILYADTLHAIQQIRFSAFL